LKFPTGIKYGCILADPAWQYDNKKTGGSLVSGAASKYPTMPLEQIKALPVKEITSKQCVLFLWVTVPLLPEGLEVLNAWGFNYKTMITWRKSHFKGLGYWYRGVTEHLLVGVKGDVKAFNSQKNNHIGIAPTVHSRKPHIFRQLIEQSCLLGPRIELFARVKVPGWDVWGNDEKLAHQTLESFGT
jgi:site-specific DNA-methyltransferase (adenine-specific)